MYSKGAHHIGSVMAKQFWWDSTTYFLIPTRLLLLECMCFQDEATFVDADPFHLFTDSTDKRSSIIRPAAEAAPKATYQGEFARNLKARLFRSCPASSIVELGRIFAITSPVDPCISLLSPKSKTEMIFRETKSMMIND